MKLTTYKRLAVYYYWIVIISALTCLASILCSCNYRITRNCSISIDQHQSTTQACISCDSVWNTLILRSFNLKKYDQSHITRY